MGLSAISGSNHRHELVRSNHNNTMQHLVSSNTRLDGLKKFIPKHAERHLSVFQECQGSWLKKHLMDPA